MQIVIVKWQDSTTYTHWADVDEVDKSSFKICYAAGLLVTQNEKQVTVALLAAEDGSAYSDWINIPAGDVLELTVVESLELAKETRTSLEGRNAQ